VFGAIDALESWMSFLAENSILTGIVFGVVLLGARFVPRRRPDLHVALWSLVMIRLVLPPGIGHPFAAGALVGRLVDSGVEARVMEAPAGNENTVPAAGPHEPGRFGLGGSGEGWLAAAVLWIAGAFVVGGVQIRRRWRIRRVLGTAWQSVDPEILAACERWRRCLGVRRAVRVVTSQSGLTPLTVGVIRPLIYLPLGATQDRRCVEAAIAHEMAHVARFDALWLGLQNLLQTVYFFNPVVWMAGAQLNHAREQLCDATVVAADRLAARDYVGGLLNVLRLELRGTGAPTMTARKRRIGMRILNIFEREHGPRPTLGAAVIWTAVIGLFLLPLGAGSAAQPPAADAVAQTVPEVVTLRDAGFVNPLADGRVTWSWGPGHRDPFTGDEVTHRGIDVAAPDGAPVIAPAEGVVRVATESFEPSPGSGTVILIDHEEGISTFYAHLGSLAVDEGQRVERGAVIATVGSTGKSTGPHLHFEVRQNGEPVDPALFVNDWK